MFDPMFANDGSWAGFSSSAIIVMVALALMVAGTVWMLRLTAGDPDPHSFRATAPTEVAAR